MSSIPCPDNDCTPDPGEALRTCRKCGESKPLGEYYVYARDGKPYSRCKPCSRSDTYQSRAKLDPEVEAAKRKAKYDENREARVQATRDYRERKRAENPKPPKPADDGTRKCTKCLEAKGREDFYVADKKTGSLFSWCKACHRIMTEANRKKNLERYAGYSAEFRRNNPEIVAESRRKYELNNRDKIRESRRKYWKANPDKLRAKKSSYFQRHKDDINAKNRRKYRSDKQSMVGRIKRWAANNPEQWAAIKARATHRRRDRLAATPCTLTGEEWKDILRLQGNRCARCNLKFTMKRKPHKDHVIPLSKGGGLTFANVQALCQRCNNEKYVDDTDYRGLIPGLLT